MVSLGRPDLLEGLENLVVSFLFVLFVFVNVLFVSIMSKNSFEIDPETGEDNFVETMIIKIDFDTFDKRT